MIKRWLLVKGHVERATGILKRTARVNGKELSEKSVEWLKLNYCPESKKNNLDDLVANDRPSLTQSISTILKSKTLCLRLTICCYQWIVCCFVYYGLSLMATHVPGKNRYISFIVVVAIEIPGGQFEFNIRVHVDLHGSMDQQSISIHIFYTFHKSVLYRRFNCIAIAQSNETKTAIVWSIDNYSTFHTCNGLDTEGAFDSCTAIFYVGKNVDNMRIQFRIYFHC